MLRRSHVITIDRIELSCCSLELWYSLSRVLEHVIVSRPPILSVDYIVLATLLAHDANRGSRRIRLGDM